MKKLLTVLSVLGSFSAGAQTLFTYGNEAVTTADFVAAFKKNNTGSTSAKALGDYLELYVSSRLKIKEAKEQRYDTLPQLQADLANLRQQILPNYLTDKESLDKLVMEAFNRSQKDVHVMHIFLAFTKNGVTDAPAAIKKEREARSKLDKGGAFKEVAVEFSDDPSVQANGGDLGWITAFLLPYEMETAIYATPPGKMTSFTSKSGIHIFKNAGERKAAGRLKASQILLAFPPGAGEAAKVQLKKKADSLYSRLLAGADFGKLATAFSNDVISAASNGQMMEFGVGDYEPVFENAVFALAKDGALTKPFLTTHGYHIVKRSKLQPVPAKADAETLEALRRRIELSDRITVTRKALAQKVIKQSGYKNSLANNSELWVYSDSVLNFLPPQTKVALTPFTVVLQLGNKAPTVNDWLAYARTYRYKTDGSGLKPYPQLWDEFTQATAVQYYEDHLEEFNPEFRRQMTEFAEGNLFFEIMQRQVWTPAQTDTLALATYYQRHRDKYVWKQSADAVVFYSTDATSATAFYKALQKLPAAWKTAVSNYSEQITTDSARFELTQLPKNTTDKLAQGSVTTPVVNKADNTTSLAYIIRLYPKEEPRNFTDARGLVITDYQAELEQQWVAELKEKYPVTINQKVWNEVLKGSVANKK